MNHWHKRSVRIDGEEVPVWPRELTLQRTGHPQILSVRFDDIERYHARLIEGILEREHDPRYVLALFRGACGVKIHHVAQWGFPEADLVQQRALALFSAATGVARPVCDMGWANIYRRGDYCLPHSHTRTPASVVYHLADGERDPGHPLGGKLCFADPRLPFCCDQEQGRVTRSLIPEMVPGMMIIFPSEAMHFVNPYDGEAPRMTLSWNIAEKRLPGSPNPELDARRKAARAGDR